MAGDPQRIARGRHHFAIASTQPVIERREPRAKRAGQTLDCPTAGLRPNRRKIRPLLDPPLKGFVPPRVRRPSPAASPRWTPSTPAGPRRAAPLGHPARPPAAASFAGADDGVLGVAELSSLGRPPVHSNARQESAVVSVTARTSKGVANRHERPGQYERCRAISSSLRRRKRAALL
jgi:hypothetical protein